MRKPPLQSTVKECVLPAVLLVSGSEALERSCRAVVERIGALYLVTCDIAEVAATLATKKPVAVLVPDVVFEFDPEELSALARAVNAILLELPGDGPLDPSTTSALERTLRRAYASRS